MRLVGLLIIVAGWLIAVGGLLATDSVEPRMVLAVVGFATSITGVVTLNGSHLKGAIWKPKGVWR